MIIIAITENRGTTLKASFAVFCIFATIFPTASVEAKQFGSFIGSNVVNTIAGSGVAGITDGPAAQAAFLAPTAMVEDRTDGSILIVDSLAQRIRRLNKSGTVTTVAGSGIIDKSGLFAQPGFQDGPASTARFNNPSGVAILENGDILVADTGNFCLRMISRGLVSTFAGVPGKTGASDGSNGEATFANPRGIAVGPNGSLFVADGPNGIRIVDKGRVSTLPISDKHSRIVANISIWSSSHDPTTLFYSTPTGIGRFDVLSQNTTNWDGTLRGVDGLAALGVSELVAAIPARGVVYFSDFNGVRRILAGDESRDTGGTGSFTVGTATESRFFGPTGLALRSSGKLLVADRDNRRVRELPLINKRFHLSDGGEYPKPNPTRYKIVYISNSFAYHDTMWNDSIEGRLELFLNKNREKLGIPRQVEIDAIRSGALGIKPQAEYINEILGLGTVDLVIWSLNSHAFLDDFSDFEFALPNLSDENRARWKTEMLNVAAQLVSAKTKLLLINQPFGTQAGPTEDYFLKESASIGITPPKAEVQRVPDYAYDFNLRLEGFLSSLRLTCYYPTYSKFIEYERGPHLPLYISDDFHFAPNGNAFYENQVQDAILRCAPWKH